MFKVKNKDNRMRSMMSLQCLYCLICINLFKLFNFSGGFIVDFEQLNISQVNGFLVSVKIFSTTFRDNLNLKFVLTFSPIILTIGNKKPSRHLLAQSTFYSCKFKNTSTRTRCQICSKLTIKTLKTQVSLLLTLNIFHTLFQYFYC